MRLRAPHPRSPGRLHPRLPARLPALVAGGVALVLATLASPVTTAHGEQAGAATLVVAPEAALDAAGAGPGRPVRSTVTLTDAAGLPAAGQTVRLSTDVGFFTTTTTTMAGLVPAPTPADGADAGRWQDRGTSVDVTTDGQGVAAFTLAVERDAGFDDDGAVAATVRATSGALTDTETVLWSSADPYNGGTVVVEPAPAGRQESGVLPLAPTTDRVLLDVVTTDQFGNRVGGESVDVADDVAGSEVDATEVVSDLAADGDVVVTSTRAQHQRVSVAWDASTHTRAGAGAAPVPGTETLNDGFTVQWYVVDRAASTYTLTHGGGDDQAVGSVVTSTFEARDQLGEPIADLFVQLFRTGPDDGQDGEPVRSGLLGQSGTLVYSLQGSRSGTATLSTIGRVGSAQGPAVAAAARTDVVRFRPATAAAVAVHPRLRMRSLADGRDRAVVSAPRAAGARVRLYRAVVDGYEPLGRGRLDASGRATVTVRDRDVDRPSRYVMVVFATPRTLIAASNQVVVR